MVWQPHIAGGGFGFRGSEAAPICCLAGGTFGVTQRRSGPASLQAAAAEWTSLSAEYASAKLLRCSGSGTGGAWEGPERQLM